MKRGAKISVIAALVLALVVGSVYFLALRLLKSQIEEALGPQGEVQDIHLSLSSVEIDGLKVRAASAPRKGIHWPAEHELQAARVIVTPDLRSLLSDTIHVHKVRIEQARLPIVRTARELLLVPSLFDQGGKEAPERAGYEKTGYEKTGFKKVALERDAPAQPAKTIRIGQIELVDGEIDFYDASLGRKVHRITLTDIEGKVRDLKLPALDEAEALEFRGRLPSDGQAGDFSLSGEITPATQDSTLRLLLRNVPLVAFQPYFIKTADTQVKRGSMYLELNSKVKSRHLHAPGNLRLQGLELSGSGGFAGLTRQAAVALIKDRSERIDLQFTLEGNLDDPRFSLNEQFYVRVGAAIAESLGLSVESLGKGAGGIAEGLGSAIKKLFGK